MDYFLNLFTPETWAAFRSHGSDISGFQARQRRTAERIEPGTIFLCYLVKLSRWCGVLEVTSQAFVDNTPIFTDPDPFVVRFRVKPLVTLDPEYSLPMLDEDLWRQLSLTQEIPFGVKGWGIPFRGSLRHVAKEDGDLLMSLLTEQQERQQPFPFSERDKRQLGRKSKVRVLDREIVVQVPEDEDEEEQDTTETIVPETRESIRVQAKLAQIGSEMGFRIWIPRADRARVKEVLPAKYHDALLEALPLTYEENTNRTIEQIDVIWLKGRSLARAFEVEHTTAIYSGLLRMADLLALQPNMDIRLHIVAPDEKREKVMSEIVRPVFSLLDRGRQLWMRSDNSIPMRERKRNLPECPLKRLRGRGTLTQRVQGCFSGSKVRVLVRPPIFQGHGFAIGVLARMVAEFSRPGDRAARPKNAVIERLCEEYDLHASPPAQPNRAG
jgi:hypothetical protein